MATIGHWWSLVNQLKTIRHLWLTCRRLLEEVDRQQREVWVVFTQMEWIDLQQKLYGSCMAVTLLHHWYKEDRNGLHHPSHPYPLYHHNHLSSTLETVINDDLSSYHESDDQLASLLLYPLPPLGTLGNPIVVSDDEDDIKSSLSCPSYHEARSMFTTPSLYLLHCQDCTDQCHYYFDCPQYICSHCLQHAPRHQVSNCPNRWSWWLQSQWGIMLQTVVSSFLLWLTCLTHLCLTPFILLIEHEFACRNTWVTKHMSNTCLPHDKHTFTSYLPHV
jgi:hypothetical protein